MAKFHTWGEFNLEKKEVPMTHAEMPPRGHIPAYGVRNLAEGREVEIYPTALPHEPFNTVEYLSVQESQAREARAREEGRLEGIAEATKEEFYGPWSRRIHIESPYTDKPHARVLKAGEVPSTGCVYIRIGEWVDARKAGAAASRSGEGEKL